ncbi:MAG TPA: hypothetical protein VJI12_00765 [archaeon]|nr:hypothetical protein [archaeon]
METYSHEITEYLQSVIKSIKDGLAGSGFDADDPIVLDLAVVNSKKTDGGFDIFVVKGKSKYDDSQISRLRITIKKRQAQ